MNHYGYSNESESLKDALLKDRQILSYLQHKQTNKNKEFHIRFLNFVSRSGLFCVLLFKRGDLKKKKSCAWFFSVNYSIKNT